MGEERKTDRARRRRRPGIADDLVEGIHVIRLPSEPRMILLEAGAYEIAHQLQLTVTTSTPEIYGNPPTGCKVDATLTRGDETVSRGTGFAFVDDTHITFTTHQHHILVGEGCVPAAVSLPVRTGFDALYRSAKARAVIDAVCSLEAMSATFVRSPDELRITPVTPPPAASERFLKTLMEACDHDEKAADELLKLLTTYGDGKYMTLDEIRRGGYKNAWIERAEEKLQEWLRHTVTT